MVEKYPKAISIYRFFRNPFDISIIKLRRMFRNIYNLKIFKKIETEFPYSYFYKEKTHIFFGYFDISPFNKNKLLSNQVRSSQKIMDVGFYDLNSNNPEFVKLGETETWCWQMGFRLQCYPRKPNHVIYNRLFQNNYGSVIQNIKKSEDFLDIKYPIYSISHTEPVILTLDFSRLESFRPGYGYQILSDSTKHSYVPKSEAIVLYNYESDCLERIVKYEDLVKDIFDKSTLETFHYVNHLSFQPGTKNFIFQHCILDGDKKRVRLLYYKYDDKTIVELCKFGFLTSHFNWIDTENLVIYLATGPLGAGYYTLNLATQSLNFMETAPNSRDGHPTFFNSSIISDTVPNQFSERELFLYNVSKNKKIIIASIFNDSNFTGSNRCDLHPRVSLKEKLLSVDCILGGYRNQLVFKIKDLLNE